MDYKNHSITICDCQHVFVIMLKRESIQSDSICEALNRFLQLPELENGWSKQAWFEFESSLTVPNSFLTRLLIRIQISILCYVHYSCISNATNGLPNTLYTSFTFLFVFFVFSHYLFNSCTFNSMVRSAHVHSIAHDLLRFGCLKMFFSRWEFDENLHHLVVWRN